ncbi:MAG: GGDEF domain-containing protein [Ruminococcus sp.]|nr:GGDEF domain-containing protein [Ruminococcus sp.]
MKTRKRLGLIIVNPEQIYQSRILDGIMTQCERYDYDVLSFTPLIDIWFQQKEYLNAEKNIFNLINFDLIDAMIVVAISMTRNEDHSEVKRLAEYLKENCPKPCISIDLPMEGAELVFTDDAPAFRKITAHILDVHKVPADKIYMLSGRHDLDISQNRVRGFREELESRGLPYDRHRVFYGDFWYSGGNTVAEKIIKGEVPMPRAVICGNDHMAIGLANSLEKAGISVPEQVIVTGFDATQDAVVNEIPMTSFVPNVSGTAQEAVNLAHRLIEPDVPEIPADEVSEDNLCIGASCGCQTNIDYIRHNFQSALYKASHDYTHGFRADTADMSTVVESYMLEKMTAAKTIDECLENIYLQTYLIAPYSDFYLMLRPDWLNTYKTLRVGYPDTVRPVVHAVPQGKTSEDAVQYHDDDAARDFPTSQLLPQLNVYREKPSIFYICPVHFQEDTLGYCILRCSLEEKVKPTAVFRNWMRNVNNALEMIRVQNRLLSYSLYDSMTGLYNRRGMDRAFSEMRRKATSEDKCFVCVIDMNWLKRINDQFGHPEGDYAIMQLARCASEMVTDERFCAVRAGGDEFFVIGIGRFDDDMPAAKQQKLIQDIDLINRESGKPYRISAGIGSTLRPFTESIKLEELIHEADMNMYRNKELIKKSQQAV